MKKPGILMISILVLVTCENIAQNISGIVNKYAAVTNISGTGISVGTATAFGAGDRVLLIQMKGATIDTPNTSGFGDITALDGAGTFEFLNVSSVAGNLINVTPALTNTYNFTSGFVQVVRVPRYCAPVVVNPVTCEPWDASAGTGGIIAFEAGTLTVNSSIDASGKGFAGGNFASSLFNCDDGNFFGIQGDDGGQKGESISAYIPFYDGRKGKQANGGGGANSGNSGGGGGGNGNAGGLGGNQYSGCGVYDERGIGGLGLSAAFSTLFMGGGGGGGYQDNGQASSNGGNGGGIIYIRANAVISNNGTITACGTNVTVTAADEGAGGGGAGGTIFIECNNFSGSLNVKTDGGYGGSNNNTLFPYDCHGTGGGGGGGVFAFGPSSQPAGVVYSSNGGAAGTVNNANSLCYNSTNGADPGINGISLMGLPVTALSFNAPALVATPSGTICTGESINLTASGAGSYTWSTGATNTLISISPASTTVYTVTATNSGTNSCIASVITTISVSECTGIKGFNAGGELKMYPNPTSGKLIFETNKPVKVTISDGVGRNILEQNFEKGNYVIDLSAYAAGVYLAKATDDYGTKVMKLVKKNE